MSSLPLPARDMTPVLAREFFQVFLEMGFAHLNPGTQFSRAWHLSAMVKVLEDVATGECKRLIITIPPRHLKSITCSVLYPAWLLGRDPTLRIIVASYGAELAAAHARNFRKVIQSAWYARVFPRTAGSIGRDTEMETGTTVGGYRLATAVGGTVTGLGADLIIIDDLMKAQDARSAEAREKAKRFVDETLLSRLDNKRTGRVISIQQRLHEDDIVDHLLQKRGFRHLNLPAIALKDETFPLAVGGTHSRRIGEALDPARESLETLEALRVEMGSRAFEAQYQQNPNPPESEYVRFERIPRYDAAPPREALHKVVHSWDPAISPEAGADYSACSVWGFDGKAWLLLEMIRVRLAYPDLLERVRAERRRGQPDVILVEKASVGQALLADLWRDKRMLTANARHRAPDCEVLAAAVRLGKEERFASQVEQLYSGFAKLPREALWLDDLRKEMTTFPNGRHDDQVDCISQFLRYAVERRGRRLVKSDGCRSSRRPRY